MGQQQSRPRTNDRGFLLEWGGDTKLGYRHTHTHEKTVFSHILSLAVRAGRSVTKKKRGNGMARHPYEAAIGTSRKKMELKNRSAELRKRRIINFNILIARQAHHTHPSNRVYTRSVQNKNKQPPPLLPGHPKHNAASSRALFATLKTGAAGFLPVARPLETPPDAPAPCSPPDVASRDRPLVLMLFIIVPDRLLVDP